VFTITEVLEKDGLYITCFTCSKKYVSSVVAMWAVCLGSILETDKAKAKQEPRSLVHEIAR
jgi:hypothetical protein